MKRFMYCLHDVVLWKSLLISVQSSAWGDSYRFLVARVCVRERFDVSAWRESTTCDKVV